ncbi:unnamed protein product [Strongylus vulgaris]|uniref:Uncharacterized protein n=1 Tax=Strongylus vulgaris TaxID=40348 RepID=A0A3P7J4U3_STRVU|nr:unnamed protein product [Strongylus vulgaris]
MYKVFGGVLDEDSPYDFEEVDDPTEWSPEQLRLVRLFEKAEFLRYRLEVLKADYDALMIRKEFDKRSKAQTERERAMAAQHHATQNRGHLSSDNFDDD